MTAADARCAIRLSSCRRQEERVGANRRAARLASLEGRISAPQFDRMRGRKGAHCAAPCSTVLYNFCSAPSRWIKFNDTRRSLMTYAVRLIQLEVEFYVVVM
jgi:hypothetical protein